jgi:uncharacterized protein (DUF1810 family)
MSHEVRKRIERDATPEEKHTTIRRQAEQELPEPRDWAREAVDGNESSSADPYHLNRFVLAQENDYHRAFIEIKEGQKRSHWMWYIFPQIAGLGHSSMAQHYAIRSIEEASAYLQHPVLGPRLLECAQAAVNVPDRTAAQIFGYPDDLKLRSCATLFAAVSPPGSVFERLLEKYYGGVHDEQTIRLLPKPKGLG